MNTRTALRKSLLIAPAEDALRRAGTQQELEDAWFDFADNFADESPERIHLRAIWDERVAYFKKADKWLSYARTL
jgi:hypothetical protein